MFRFNPLLRRKPPVIWSYGIAFFTVLAALTISRWPALHLHDAPVSLFLCGVMVSAWLGGIGPGLLATNFRMIRISSRYTSNRCQHADADLSESGQTPQPE